ncbi:MAG TPA: DoxX family membrane protein [Vicinamibacterales bacterium]|nr:DoxX family membrane protein [Vicinamibacterales bacterium]
MSHAKVYALLFLRLSLGLLMLVWGVDKLANPTHGMAVAEGFYFGLLGARALMPVLGIAQLGLGLLVILGLARRYVYIALAAVTGVTLIGVWRSVLNPWGWYLGRTNALFFPSLIIFAGVLVLLAFRDEDQLVLWRAPRSSPNRVKPETDATSARTLTLRYPRPE